MDFQEFNLKIHFSNIFKNDIYILHMFKKIGGRFSTKRIMLSESNDKRVIQALEKIHEQKLSKISLITENDNLNKNIPEYLLESEVLDLKIYKKGETQLNNIDIGHKLLSIGEVDGIISGNISPTKDVIKSALKYTKDCILEVKIDLYV